MMTQTQPALQPPRKVQGEALKMFGISRRYEDSKEGIPSQWAEFAPHIHSIPNQTAHVSYGVIYNANNKGHCDYLCAVAVSEYPDYPGDFTRLELAPQTYAVFEHTEHISGLPATLQEIWTRGLQQFNLKPVHAPAFERYDKRYHPSTGLGGLEIWVPVEA